MKIKETVMNLRHLALGLALALPVAATAQTTAPTTPAPTTPPAAAAPQGQQDMVNMLHLAAHNQLGVLEYCQAQGSIGPDVVALQKRMLTMLPPAQVDGLDAAEATGKRGVVQFGGSEVAIADAAKARSTTADAMCKQMGQMLESQAAMLPK